MIPIIEKSMLSFNRTGVAPTVWEGRCRALEWNLQRYRRFLSVCISNKTSNHTKRCEQTSLVSLQPSNIDCFSRWWWPWKEIVQKDEQNTYFSSSPFYLYSISVTRQHTRLIIASAGGHIENLSETNGIESSWSSSTFVSFVGATVASCSSGWRYHIVEKFQWRSDGWFRSVGLESWHVATFPRQRSSTLIQFHCSV